MTPVKSILFLLTVAACGSLSLAQNQDFTIDDLPLPQGVPPEVGALEIIDDHLFLVLRRGDVFRKPLSKLEDSDGWVHFAEGLHNPLGAVALSKDKLVVSQMAELTEIEDLNGDGWADQYLSLTNEFGLTGNYHETNAMCSDGDGGFFIAMGTASHNGPIFQRIKGAYSPEGRRGRNFSAAQWNGWVMHYTNGELKPFASGFRQPNGIFLDSKNRLWAGDNEGDWRACSPLFLVERGNFHGHPASLVWDEKHGDAAQPTTYSVEKVDSLRTRPHIRIPYKDGIRSLAGIQEIPETFGAFAGQLVVADNNARRLGRVIPDRVKNQWQGAFVHLIEDERLNSGNNRLRFTPDGQRLLIGQTTRGWGKLAEGLQSVILSSESLFELDTLRLTEGGFRLRMTNNINFSALSGDSFRVRSFTYHDTWLYGGEPEDVRTETVASFEMEDELTILVKLQKLEAGRVYHLDLGEVFSISDQSVGNPHVFYTANQIP